MATLTAGRSTIFSSPKLPTVGQSHRSMVQLQARPVGLCPRISLRLIRSPVQGSSRMQSASVIFASVLDARCGAEQTQTIIRKAPTITNVPGKEKFPRVDNYDGGPPPNKNNGGGDDGDGGPGDGGAGGFGFFGFLLFLSFLKDIESEGSYRDNRRK